MRVILASHCAATPGLTVILTLGQETTPITTTSRPREASSPDKFNVQRPLQHATRGLLVTDHVILNHGQVTWTTPELVAPSPNYHTTPREDFLSLDRFNEHRCPTWWVFSGTGLELMTCLP
ncbi:uncharacterized protein TNCV_1391271 [Trichonephila clavipes]|nr:uncharacterized protein TNCV_1391271 [Trichonephila clavipes]